MSMLSVTELADRWNVNRKTVLNYIRDKKLPAIRTPGGNYRIRLWVIEEWEAGLVHQETVEEGEDGEPRH
jgi:excisionase family DNA binding protein